MSFEVQLNRRAERDLKGFADDVQDTLLSTLGELEANPFAGDHKKLRGSKDEHRRRVGKYRITYFIDTKDRLVRVVSIKLRRDAYR